MRAHRFPRRKKWTLFPLTLCYIVLLAEYSALFLVKFNNSTRDAFFTSSFSAVTKMENNKRKVAQKKCCHILFPWCVLCAVYVCLCGMLSPPTAVIHLQLQYHLFQSFVISAHSIENKCLFLSSPLFSPNETERYYLGWGRDDVSGKYMRQNERKQKQKKKKETKTTHIHLVIIEIPLTVTNFLLPLNVSSLKLNERKITVSISVRRVTKTIWCAYVLCRYTVYAVYAKLNGKPIHILYGDCEQILFTKIITNGTWETARCPCR